MSIGEFATDIITDNLPSMVKNHYDEVIVLYNVLNHRPEIKSITANIMDDHAEFIIRAKSNKDAKNLFSKYNRSTFTAFEDIFNMMMELQDNSIITTISK